MCLNQSNIYMSVLIVINNLHSWAMSIEPKMYTIRISNFAIISFYEMPRIQHNIMNLGPLI